MKGLELATKKVALEARKALGSDRAKDREAARKAREAMLAAARLGSDEAPWLAATDHHREHFARTGEWVATVVTA